MAYRDYPDWQIEAGDTLASQAEACGLDLDDTLYLFMMGGLPHALGEEILQARSRRAQLDTIRVPDQAVADAGEEAVIIDLTDRSLARPSS